MEGHICRQNTLMFALVFCFELRARAARTCYHCHLQAAVKNPIHDGKRGQLKLPKKVMNGTTMWSCDTELCTNGVEATKWWVFVTFFNLLDFTVSLSYRDWHSETPWSHSSNQPGGTYCTGFLVAHQLYIGNVMHKYKIGKSSPHQPCENTCHSNVLESSLLWMARALACF